MHNLFLVCPFPFSTCFGQLCAHHQEKHLCLCDTWYLLFCVDDCLVCRVEFHPAYRTVIHSCFSWCWAHSRPKHVEIDKYKYTKNKLCTSKKVKVTLVQALRLCTGRTAHRGIRGIALPFHDHGTRRGWGVSVTPRPLFTPGKDPVPIVQEAGWAPGPVWTAAEKLAPTGIRSPDCPARSQSLYRPSYRNM